MFSVNMFSVEQGHMELSIRALRHHRDGRAIEERGGCGPCC